MTRMPDLPETTDEMRKGVIRNAVERELAVTFFRPEDWAEIKDRTLEELLSANTDALAEDFFELREQPEVDSEIPEVIHAHTEEIKQILTAIKVSTEILGPPYAHYFSQVTQDYEEDEQR